ncbi:MAG: arylesterase [Casimicrobiaceae bacterium]|nr:arylesterase [Casimicrobiaceae bacterium]MCX8098448.1 arylesterase [Casimicrobiaceae bacterium]
MRTHVIVSYGLRWWRHAVLALLLGLAGACAASGATLLILGDSLSAGYGLSRGEGWVELLERKLASEKVSARVVNASVSGETTAGGLSRLPALLREHRPSILVIELGGNDGLRGAPPETIRANLERMARLGREAGARVVILGMRLPPNYGPSYTAAFERTFREAARATGSELVPFFLERLGTDFRYFQPDRIHPTAAAQPLMLETVWPTLRRLLNTR